jgi:zinc transport system substrate-binding protein
MEERKMAYRSFTIGGALLATTALLLAACSSPAEREEAAPDAGRRDGPLVVYTVNYPLAYFAERIGGDRVRVQLPVPPDLDPAFWSPDAETVAAYQGADLILLNGAGYAGWVRKVTLPASRLVDTSAGFRERYLLVEDAVLHSHGPGGEHSHGETAFTTWLDPTLALEQARAIHRAFVGARPGGSAVFDEALGALEADLEALDRRMAAAVARSPGRSLLGSHPVYQYLAGRYGLKLRSVHFEPGEYPDGAAWQDLADLLGDHPAAWMLWEGEPVEETAARLRALGIESVVFDPCGNRPERGDWLTVMEANAEGLERVFAP